MLKAPPLQSQQDSRLSLLLRFCVGTVIVLSLGLFCMNVSAHFSPHISTERSHAEYKNNIERPAYTAADHQAFTDKFRDPLMTHMFD
ncbi:MAG: hypothetical protein AAF810_21120 [Cyanobacteria bacterium P01_D01_bin.36]